MRVLYTRGDTLLGPVIRRFSSGAQADHCGVLMDGEVWDVALGSPVQPRPLDAWLSMRGRRLVLTVDVPLADERAAAAKIRSCKGVGYDYLGAVGIPFGAWEIDDPRRLICTGLPFAGISEGEPPLAPPLVRARSWAVDQSVIHCCSIAAARADRGGRVWLGAELP